VRKQEISPLHELFDPNTRLGKPTKRKVPFLPDQVFFETALIVLLTFAFIAINYFFWNAHLESHANPTQTPQHTKAPWYFLWLQGGLKFGDKTWFGLAWPGVIFGALFLLPYLDRNPSRQFRHRKVALGSGALVLAFLGFMTYAGLPTYGIQQTASQELLTEFVPVEGEGILDHADWSALPTTSTIFRVNVGENNQVSTEVVDEDGNPIDEATLSQETRNVFEKFRHAVEGWVTRDERFKQPTAELIIEPWVFATREEDGKQVQVTNPETGQPELLIKRATVDLRYLSTQVDPQTGEVTVVTNQQGEPETSRSVQTDFLHRESHEVPMEDIATEPRNASR
jgi:hypothetical protein